ncbi:hypothetical protein KS4_34760 [Poriferisphaera corsica]|uniref:PEP-CTERM protein-sorting domain-containing protein n=1 Tax=Poriferisphaera corsica TaxID=2528020 RepID=A0A517YYU8_9BACT|nr:PEP-CTERM sorting domain-containing protein [Poriferisphaera corsica]QDU35395.1 hypothetical protein KS4_34760 [Poriferisphaera corsica]
MASRYLRTFLHASILASCALISLPLTANIDLDTTLDQESHIFTPAIPEFGIPSASRTTITTDTNNISRFAHDFSSAGQTTLSYTINSSTGGFYAHFEHAGSLTFAFRDGGTFGGIESFSPTTTITVADESGSPPQQLTFSSSIRGTNDTNASFAMVANMDFAAGSSYSFSSITFNITFPASYDGVLPTLPGSPTLEILGTINDAPQDLGQFVSINPIPEPASISLLAITTLTLLRRRK